MIELDYYSTPKTIQKAIKFGYLQKGYGMLLDLNGIPEDYEVVVRSIHNKRHSSIIFQNFKNRE